jgi:hypothetical protein
MASINSAPRTAAERDEVLSQMERILGHWTFKNSPRSSRFLRYVIEFAARGDLTPLKERTLGIEAFGRDPDYDTDQDTVVRVTASDVRKRLAQYYHESGHEAELQIDMHPGSYIPELRWPAKAVENLPPPRQEAAPVPPVGVSFWGRARKKWATLVWATGFVALLGILAWTWRYKTVSLAREDPARSIRSNLNLFWSPILSPNSQILLSIGEQPQSGWTDSMAIEQMTVFLVRRNKQFQLKTGNFTTSSDLKQGSSLLIGSNNLMSFKELNRLHLRFHFQAEPSNQLVSIEDISTPAKKWTSANAAPQMGATRDYAILARYLDPESGQWVVIAAGLGEPGTDAACSVLTDGKLMDQFSKQTHEEWAGMNFEAVISTPVLNNKDIGPIKLEAIEIWPVTGEKNVPAVQ